jgi:hypothetical protein
MFLTLVIYFSCSIYFADVRGEISRFPRQEINDGIHDGLYVNTTSSNNKNNTVTSTNDSHDLIAVSHFSDGKNLNSTLWFLGIVRNDSNSDKVKSASYGILVDVDNNPFTGRLGVDYQKEIKWNTTDNFWTSSLIEYSSSGNQKIEIATSNITITQNQSFFPISLDLDSITSPAKFRVSYYSMEVYKDSANIIDMTNWVDVPPAQFSLSTLPKSLVLTQGESLDIGAQLVSNTGSSPQVLNIDNENNNSHVLVNFNPNGVNFSSFGIAPLPFRITAPSNAQVGQYTIPLLANVSLEMTPTGILGILGNNTSSAGDGYITVRPNLTVSVIERPPFGQEFRDFWTTYGQVISLFGAGFAGGFSTHIMDRIKERREEKRKRRESAINKEQSQ